MTTAAPEMSIPSSLNLHLTVLGRTLEHLGSQMYKRRDVAIAELVANAWDAGAKSVKLIVPTEDYDQATSSIEILDDGSGMTASAVQTEFLVIGRNRRNDSTSSSKRPVMGKKGIGKLAGFGMAQIMEITTWVGGEATSFVLDLSSLKAADGKSTEMPIEGQSIVRPGWCKSESGTRIILRRLKHKTAPDVSKLIEALARRFSSRIRGEMDILVNGSVIGEPKIELDFRFPNDGQESEILPSGNTISYHYAFAKETIKSPELRGFTVYVRGRTAQAPPFFFDVEGTASGQHSTKYVTGSIDADFLDEGADDASDVISTDRQHIDWELPEVAELRIWGEALARRVLRECAETKGTKLKDWLIGDPKIAPRLEKLEKSARDQISKFLIILGKAEPDETRALELADSLVQAFEYRHFHDVIGMIEDASNSDDPHELEKLLINLHEWKVLESRAILEIVRGRIGVIDRFRTMVVDDAPETKSKLSNDNLHDLIAGYPWLLNPEWQVLSEERKLSTQLREWGHQDIQSEDEEMRYDFLALTDERRLVIVEIKRSGHPVTFEELTRLDKYRERLAKSEQKEISVVLVYGGTIDVSPEYIDSWRSRSYARLLKWSELHSRNRAYYEHYQAVLERDIDNPSFNKKELEVASTRKLLSGGSVHRSSVARKEGLGPQDVNWAAELTEVGKPTAQEGEKKTPQS